MAKSKTVFHLSTHYGDKEELSFSYWKTENSSVTVRLNEERSAAAHRFIVTLCEEQLREEEDLPNKFAKQLAAPAAAPVRTTVYEPVKPKSDDEIPF